MKRSILMFVCVSFTMILIACSPTNYTVSFDTGPSVEVFQDVTLNGQDVLNLPVISDFIYEGSIYQFKHWALDEVAYDKTNSPKQDMTLNAVYDVFLGILFDTGIIDTQISPIRADAGADIVAPKVIPEKTGYVFRGWLYDQKPFIFDVMPTASIKLEASYALIDDQYNQLTSLPKMFINLSDNYPLAMVEKSDYVDAQITITGTNYPLYSVSAEFKGRGHGSWTGSGPKKGYRLKFYEKESLLGNPESRHWVILAGANFYDTTLLKNAVAFNLARDVFDHIAYTSSTSWVEVYINGAYRGIYLVAEHVRVANDRVAIDSDFGVLDTGYFIEYDAYGQEEGPEGVAYFNVAGFKYPFVMKSPDFEDYLEEGITLAQYKAQVAYIKDYVTLALQAALIQDLDTFNAYADIDSFIDMYLLHELLKNTDTGWSSFYMYKPKGGKLFAGPAWDFDASQGKNRGDTSPYGYYVSDQVMASSDFTASELYISLMQIPEFKAMVLSRWVALSNRYKAFINTFLSDAFIAENKLAFGINFYRWSNRGPGYGYYPTITDGKTTWETDVKILRNWILTRAAWFDDEATNS